MNYLYLVLNISSLIIPFLFSFHPKIKLYKIWKPLFIAIGFTMVIYIIWDVIFTKIGIWGFNENYFLGIKFFNLPIEEWLFFICIPYACIFMHYALLVYLPNMILTKKATQITLIILIILFISIMVINYNKWYTLINFGYAILLILIVKKYNFKLFQQYLFTFLFMLIPFFLINGILTGSFIHNEVVWYNNNENLGIRIVTIPVEDIIYAFTLILTNLFILQLLQKKLFK